MRSALIVSALMGHAMALPWTLNRRQTPCAPTNPNNDPVGTTVNTPDDTAASFLAFPEFQTSSTGATTPAGYTKAFTNLQGSTEGSSFTGRYNLGTYDPAACAAFCGTGCSFFNIFYERDPTLSPAPACADPASYTRIVCTTWGIPKTQTTATNLGATQEQFQLVITGSNGYNKAPTGYTGPFVLNGAINAPLDTDGTDTYLGFKTYPGTSDINLCLQACNDQTGYNRLHPDPVTCNYKACRFVNSYILTKNGASVGLVCSMYTREWDPTYGVNTGQTRGTDIYVVGESLSFTNTTIDAQNIPNCNST